jgi:hypothetical protein
MPKQLRPDQAVRLLRAKVGELEGMVKDYVSQPHHIGGMPPPQDMALAADIALLASILADLIERLDDNAALKQEFRAGFDEGREGYAERRADQEYAEYQRSRSIEEYRDPGDE